jgi:hypothetical protein
MKLLERLMAITKAIDEHANKAQQVRTGENIFRAVILEQAGNRLGDPLMSMRLIRMESTGVEDPIALQSLETTERLIKWAEEDALRMFVE